MIKLLDCTLRDGGYINDWEFGKEQILDITEKLEDSNVDILEIGFLRPESYDENRTIFNNIEQFKSIVKNKKSNVQYALMAEVSNPFPLDKLPPATPEGPDIIRVIVWKKMLKEGFEYCKGIVEKGYKLCVQPARVSQYTDEEFIDMLKLYSTLNPLAIYVVDSWGTMYKDELLHYLNLANANLSPEISVGYHGHNNLMQAFEVACVFCEQNLNRDLIIDASVYGIGRGAGNLNTELFAKWMNEKFSRNYDLEKYTYVFDKYIKKIYEKTKWGYSIPFYITAKYNANPNFAGFFEEEKVSAEIMESAISLLSPEERIIYTKDKAQNALRLANKKKWNKRLVVGVVTANRPEAIQGYLEVCAKSFWELGIDLRIFDSSDDNKTKDIVADYSQKYDNVIYDRWDGIYDGYSIDNKVIDAYKEYSNRYEYIWLVRDGLPINIKNCIWGISKYIDMHEDIIVVQETIRDINSVKEKEYHDCSEFFKDQIREIQTLGFSIIKSTFINNVITHQPLNSSNYGLWQPIAFFQYWEDNPINAACWSGSLLLSNPQRTQTSFWAKNLIKQWGKTWYDLVMGLPTIYDKYKAQVLPIETYDFSPFTFENMLTSREFGGFCLTDIIKNRKALSIVANRPIWQLYLVSLIPKCCVSLIKKKVVPYRKKKCYRKNLQSYLRKNNIIDYDTKVDRFEKTKNIKSYLLYEEDNIPEKPFITVFIPTYKRVDLLKEAIDSVINQTPVDFDWDIVIVDNEPYDGFVNKTEKLIRGYKTNKIRYYRNEKNLRPGDNFNRGIYLAKAPWVMMLHDDDMLFPYALEKMKFNIDVLSSNESKSLGAIATSNYVFTYDKNHPEAHKKLIKDVSDWWMKQRSRNKFYKLTRNNIMFTGHIGGSVPTCGAVYNKAAVINQGGFNDDLGISADLILYYQLEKNYRVYQTFDPYGFYRWGCNSMSSRESTHRTIKDNNDFREYVYSQNLFTKIWGSLFRSSIYYEFTKIPLANRKNVSNQYITYADYADIYNKKPNKIAYWLWKKVLFRVYQYHKKIEIRDLRHKFKKYLKTKGEYNGANK